MLCISSKIAKAVGYSKVAQKLLLMKKSQFKIFVGNKIKNLPIGNNSRNQWCWKGGRKGSTALCIPVR